jgi:RimJ/RimL family protein N-acetyltransferase
MLRRATPTDLPTLVALARAPEVAGTLSTTAADSLAEASASGDAGELLVIEIDGALAGGVRWVLLNRRSRIADVQTLMLDPAFRGRGAATDAVRDLCTRLVRERGLHRIEAEVYGFNTAAQAVFERAGFTMEGRRRSAYDRNGDWQDGVRYGLLADELLDTDRRRSSDHT